MGRICMDAGTIRHLHRDGLGWGHDLDCGCFHAEAGRQVGPLRRIWHWLVGGRD